MEDSFSLLNLTKSKHPSLPYKEMKEKVLGKKYILSLVFIGEKRSKDLNKKHRGKDKVANVLSFPYSPTEGEIFITLKKAQREARNFNKSYKKFVGYLAIHGLLHLKGMDHGSKMDETEIRLSKFFHV
ncbi:MAG: rRNA maturation RNase YbeY [Candidatus Pacebacteria bacterium]|nr:rRNA maturation RNase YbeY [Candidatus Paceibacterota bacterium]